jgi:hypothetical protein
MQDAVLDAAHDCVGPEVCVPVEVSAHAMAARKMQACDAVGQRFDLVVAVKDVEVRSADADVFVECCVGDVLGVGVNGEAEAVIGLPGVHGLGEENTSGERRVTHRPPRMKVWLRPGLESRCGGSMQEEVRRANGSHALDVVPDDIGGSVNVDSGGHGADAIVVQQIFV